MVVLVGAQDVLDAATVVKVDVLDVMEHVKLDVQMCVKAPVANLVVLEGMDRHVQEAIAHLLVKADAAQNVLGVTVHAQAGVETHVLVDVEMHVLDVVITVQADVQLHVPANAYQLVSELVQLDVLNHVPGHVLAVVHLHVLVDAMDVLVDAAQDAQDVVDVVDALEPVQVTVILHAQTDAVQAARDLQ